MIIYLAGYNSFYGKDAIEKCMKKTGHFNILHSYFYGEGEFKKCIALKKEVEEDMNNESKQRRLSRHTAKS